MTENRKQRLSDVRNQESLARLMEQIQFHRTEAERAEVCLSGVKSRMWLEWVKPVIDAQLSEFSRDVWDPEALPAVEFQVRRAVALKFQGLRDSIESRATEEYRKKHLTKAEELFHEYERVTGASHTRAQ